ncbi:MAG: hypothetical protein HVN35_00835 [Methanobacteriaceae archaeon]|nr:hypothetical protein [Methanobacteriaceae archaeon]
MVDNKVVSKGRPFSLKIYLLIIFVLSWPFLMVTAWAAIVNNGTFALILALLAW